MIFSIDPNSPKSVYQQIIDQVKYAVASGRLFPGDKLGSIREVAVQTRVNRNTIARAYRELENEGVIISKAGQGSFIKSDGPDIAKNKAKKILSELIDELLAQARQFRFTQNEILELFNERLEKVNLNGI